MGAMTTDKPKKAVRETILEHQIGRLFKMAKITRGQKRERIKAAIREANKSSEIADARIRRILREEIRAARQRVEVRYNNGDFRSLEESPLHRLFWDDER